MQVLAHLHVNRDADADRTLKGLAQAGEDEALKGRRKGAELDLAKLMALRMPALKLLDQHVSHADAHPRVVVADTARRLDAVAQHLHLLRHGHVAQHQHLAGDQHVSHASRSSLPRPATSSPELQTMPCIVNPATITPINHFSRKVPASFSRIRKSTRCAISCNIKKEPPLRTAPLNG